MTPRVRRYAADIAFWHGIQPAQIFSLTRGRLPVATARADVMRRLRADGFHTHQIGRWLGRDHSTVVYHTSPRA